jgi:hypothetical protein
MAGLTTALAHPAVPGIGVLPGKLFLKAPAPVGTARPFDSGEWMVNPNGSWSSEMANTIQHPALNNGQPTNVPTLWIIDGKPTRVTDEQAAILAAKSGLNFPAYRSKQEAQEVATVRENNWQSTEPQNSGSVPTIWSRPPQPTPRPAYAGPVAPQPQ